MRLYTLRTMGTVVGYGLAGQRSVRSRAPSAGPGVVAEEILDLGKEPGGLGLGFLRRQLFELGQQLTLALGQVLRRLDHDLHVHVTGLFRAQDRHTFACQPEPPSRLGST